MVTTDEGPVHLLDTREGTGLPVVLLHGASGNLQDWTAGPLPRLAARHRVIAPDRPGFGHTPAQGHQSWLLEAQRRPLSAALDALGIGQVVLVGHSWSGALALDWALAEPGRIAGLVVLSGAAMDWGGALGGHYRLGSAPVIGPLVALLAGRVIGARKLEETVRCIFSPQPMPEGYVTRAGVRLALRPATFRQNVRAMAALHDQICRNQPQYPRISCPVEIIHGTADTIVPAQIHAGPLSETIPGARLTLLDGMGHMPHHDPRGVAALEAALGRLATDAA